MKSLRQVWAAAQYLPEKRQVSKQNAKHSTIETGLYRKADYKRIPFTHPPRSEEGSLRDYVPQAGLGGSPRAPLGKESSFRAECEAFYD